MPLTLTVTNAGRAALVNAANTGTAPVTIAQVGLSGTAVVPAATANALPGEFKRLAALSGDVVADDTIHLIVRDESADAFTVRSAALYLGDGTLFAIYGQADVLVEKSAQALMLLAIDVRFEDIDAAAITFGDANFLNPPATTEQIGVVELSTLAETIAGTDAARVPAAKMVKDAVFAWMDARFGMNNAGIWHPGNDGAGSGLDADLLDGQQGSYYTNIVARLGYTPWGPGNDGAGSGLDADLLDGYQASEFARLASGPTFAGTSVTVAPNSTAASFLLAGSGFAGAQSFSLRQGISGVSNGGFSIRDESNGVNRFNIASNGNVGFGSPGNRGRLTVLNADPAPTTAAGVNALVLGESSDNGAYQLAAGMYYSGGWFAAIDAIAGGVGTILQVQPSGGHTVVGGKLGIGTTAPTAPITVRMTHATASPTAYTGGILIHDEVNGIAPHLSLGVAYDGGNQHSWIQSNSAAGVYPLALNPAGGNVGVGTTSPKTRLHVTSNVVANVTPTMGSAANTSAVFTNAAGLYGLAITPSGTGTVHLQAQRFDGATTPYDITINPMGGNVGVGTTAPVAKLTVAGDTGLLANGGLRFYNQANNNWSGIYNPSTGALASLAILDGSGSGIRLDGSGNVDISSGALRQGGNQVWHIGNDGAGSGLDADLLDGQHGSAYALRGQDVTFRDVIVSRGDGTGVVYFSGTGLRYLHYDGSAYVMPGAPLAVNGGWVWTAANDGAGSGLDADLLDGVQGASYARLDTSGTFQAAMNMSTPTNGAGAVSFLGRSDNNANRIRFLTSTASAELAVIDVSSAGVVDLSTGTLRRGGNTVWDAANDGAGSGLDADLLDGLQGSAYNRVVESSLTENGGYRKYADGYIECWGYADIAANTTSMTVNLPVAHTGWVNPSLSGGLAIANADENYAAVTGIVGAPPTGFTVSCSYTTGHRFYWNTRGK